MARSSIIDPSNDLGRELTLDIGALVLSLPWIAQTSVAVVVLPFIYAACLALVVLFFTPLHEVPFVAQRATAGLDALRLVVVITASLNFIFGGYVAEAFSLQWLLSLFAAVIALGIFTIDVRRVFRV